MLIQRGSISFTGVIVAPFLRLWVCWAVIDFCIVTQPRICPPLCCLNFELFGQPYVAMLPLILCLHVCCVDTFLLGIVVMQAFHLASYFGPVYFFQSHVVMTRLPGSSHMQLCYLAKSFAGDMYTRHEIGQKILVEFSLCSTNLTAFIYGRVPFLLFSSH